MPNHPTPVGDLWITLDPQGALTRLSWSPLAGAVPFPPPLKDWLEGYFLGHPPATYPAMAPLGTPFQQRIWKRLLTIPFGRRMTYGEVAALEGTHARAVGQAVGRNPIPILIPCHRVVAGQGLGGFSGGAGVATKAWLLAFEHDKRDEKG